MTRPGRPALLRKTSSPRPFVRTASAAALLFLIAAPLLAVQAVPLARYLDYARASADWTFAHQADLIEAWKKSFDPKNVFGYRPPGGLLEMAVIDSYFAEKEGQSRLAARAKKVLLEYGEFRSQYPAWAKAGRPDYARGVPALPDFFTTMRYIRAFDALKRMKALLPAESKAIETLIADSLAYLLRTQEWGPMNRAALRAESLAWACRAMPADPRAPTWDMQRRAIGDDNWGKWEIEDASLYNGVWLYAMCGYADALGRLAELFRTPVMYYYARYFLELMSPQGMVPDFGDAHWNSNWPLFLVFFEASAKQYGDPGFKWAAATIARKFIDFDKPTNVGLGYNLLDCARFGTDGLKPAPPAGLSAEALDDVQGKKVVFRSGWEPNSTYLLLNYRDEGDGGLYFRDYLRDTIPIEEEKVTHGHSDENGISLLMSGGSVLLHDGGYRDFMPSGPYGAYRADIFHNRTCVRPEKMFLGQDAGGTRFSTPEAVPGQGLLEFLRDAGSYRKVRTAKVDFLTFPDFDYSRTRLVDDGWGYQSDRVIVYVKDPEMFVVFDILGSERDGYLTFAQLWHSRRVLARGEDWFDTRYDRILNESLPGGMDLLVVLPKTEFRLTGSEPQVRHGQEEVLFHQTLSRHFEPGGKAVLTAVLVPHRSDEAPRAVLERIKILAGEDGSGVCGLRVRTGPGEIILAAKTDLRREMIHENSRPKYTPESGLIRFGGFETNGDFVFGRAEGRDLAYTIVNLTRASFAGQTLVEAQPTLFGLAFDGRPDGPAVGKLRYWRDKAVLTGR
jgi:hypothetical protein